MPGRTSRRLLIGLVLIVLLLAVLVALAPTIVSATFGPGLVRGAIAARVQGDVSVDALRVSWTGPQRVEGLRIVEPDGREAVRADLTLDGSLLGLVRGSGPHVVRISGALAGDVRADGSTTFGDLPAPAPAPDAAPVPDEPFDLAGIPAFTVVIEGIDVALGLPEGSSARTLDVRGLAGKAQFVPGSTLVLDLAGATVSGGLDGSVLVHLDANGLVGADGALRPSGVPLGAKVHLAALPVPFDERIEQLESLTVDVTCADLAVQPAVVVLGATTLVAGAAPSRLDGTLTLEAPFAADGALRIGPERVRGTITGAGVPTALLQPLVAGTGVELRRDLGPALETIDVAFAPDASGATDVRLQVAAEHADVDVAALVGADGRVDARTLAIGVRLQPALADALLGMTLDAPAPIALTARRLVVPPRGADGAFDLAAIDLDATVALDAPVTVSSPTLPQPVALGRSALTFVGAPLGAALDLDGTLALAPPPGGAARADAGTLTVDLRAAQPLGADGGVRVGLGTVGGTITGSSVSTALLQAFLADTGIDVARDLGPTLDTVALTFAPLDADRSDVTARLVAANADLDVEATVTAAGALDARRLDATARLQPALAEAILGVALDAPARIVLTTRRLAVPAPGADGGLDLAAVALDATLALDGPVAVTAPGLARPVALGASALTLVSEGLGAGVEVDGTVALEGGTVAIEERLARLLDADGRVNAGGVTADGTITVTGVSTDLVRALLADAADPAVLDAALAGALGATLTTSTTGGDQRAELRVTSGDSVVTADATRTASAVRVASATASLVAAPALVAALQAGSEAPATVAAPVTVAVALARPVVLPSPTSGAIEMPEAPVGLTITVPKAVVAHPKLAEAVAVEVRPTTVELSLAGARRVDVALAATVARATTEATVAALDGTVGLDLDAAAPSPVGTIRADLRSVRALETVLGLATGAVADWTGAAGLVTVDLASDAGVRRATLTSALPDLSGSIIAEQGADAITLRDGTFALKLAKPQLQRLLFASDAAAGGPGPAPARFTVTKDAAFTATVKGLTIPTALLAGEPVDPDAFVADAGLTGGPITIAENEAVVASLADLAVTLTATGFASPLKLDVTGDARGPAGSAPGKLDVEATLRGLLDAESRFDPSRAVLSYDAAVEHVPTILVDRILGWSGTLVAAFGADVSITGKAEDFSTQGGTLDVRVDTEAGTFLAASLVGGDDAIRTTKEKPLAGELAFRRELRDKVLKKVHPIFGDIRTTEDRHITFRVPTAAVLPVGGDLRRLEADLEIEVGDVEFDRSSGLLGLLKLAGDSRSRSSVPGRIDPIKVKVRGGVLTYERFNVVFDDFTMRYEGRVDLVTRELELRTSVPLSSLSMDLSRYRVLGNAAIPLVTKGTIDANKTEADLSGLLEGVDVGGILGDLLGGGKKK